ncbi:MAG: hypothetical protein JWQ04_544 [Pedosphaera sp.]|nr:hypothetical protein [Pedosphaera sp.]
MTFLSFWIAEIPIARIEKRQNQPIRAQYGREKRRIRGGNCNSARKAGARSPREGKHQTKFCLRARRESAASPTQSARSAIANPFATGCDKVQLASKSAPNHPCPRSSLHDRLRQRGNTYEPRFDLCGKARFLGRCRRFALQSATGSTKWQTRFSPKILIQGSSPLSRRDRSDRSEQFPGLVTDANRPGLHHAGIQAAQAKLPAQRRIDKLHCLQTEARGEFFTSGVRRSRDFDDSGAEAELCSHGQILNA